MSEQNNTFDKSKFIKTTLQKNEKNEKIHLTNKKIN